MYVVMYTLEHFVDWLETISFDKSLSLPAKFGNKLRLLDATFDKSPPDIAVFQLCAHSFSISISTVGQRWKSKIRTSHKQTLPTRHANTTLLFRVTVSICLNKLWFQHSRPCIPPEVASKSLYCVIGLFLFSTRCPICNAQFRVCFHYSGISAQ